MSEFTFDTFKNSIITAVFAFLAGGGTALLVDYMKAPRQLTPDEIVKIVQQSQAQSPYVIDKPQIELKIQTLSETLAKNQGRNELQIDSINAKLYSLTLMLERMKTMMEFESESKKKGEDSIHQ